MAEKLIVPESGELGDEIILLSWLKTEGEMVKAGEQIAEIEAQKGTLEIEAPVEGCLIARIVEEGDSVFPGDILGYLGNPGEEIPVEPGAVAAAEPAAEPSKKPSKQQQTAVKIMPAARKRAKELGIDTSAIAGSGPGNMITAADIERAAQENLLTKNQRAVAGTVIKSHGSIPPIHLTIDIDMTKAKRIQEQGVRFDALLIKTASAMIESHPKFARVMENGVVRELPFTGIGYALSVGGDLFTPIVADPLNKSLKEIDAEIDILIDQVFEGTIPARKLKGFTLLMSNLGMYDINSFDAIIPPGASAAIAFGAIRDIPAVVEGKIVVRPIMTATLTIDHRVLNGADGAKFLAWYKKRLENIELDEAQD
jgi:pyruvate dehydrogenase E2 component (dihydrolipoamide acetyltransferase)